MNIHITLDDGIPIYLQIVRQIKFLVSSEGLSPSAELPSIRALAEQLVVSPNTVARAYRELQADGIVVKRGTVGTYVSDAAPRVSAAEGLRALEKRVDVLLSDAKHLGVSLAEVGSLLEQRSRLMEQGDEDGDDE